MLGSSFLVAPKIVRAEPVPEKKFFSWGDESAPKTEIQVYLPPDALWYNYFSKEPQADSSQVREIMVPESEQGLFVKGGSIVPISLHGKRLSVLRIKNRPIRLEVYVDR